MAPFPYLAWVAASTVLVPFASRSETAKLARADVPRSRAREKLGFATGQRDATQPLVWFHAASVGESLSVLALITRIGAALPDTQFLITSGTATSADLIARRMPPRCQHQFAPLDAPGPLRRFLKHWCPDAAIFVESELWPQMLRRTHASGARMALVNARLSTDSVKRWQQMPATARYMLDVFDLILTQNDAMAETIVSLGAPPARVARGINLKSMADPLPVDHAALAEAQTALRNRPVWIASSTHQGEEQSVLKAHQRLLRRWPDLCLILAPRHPARGQEVADLITEAGMSHSRRSAGDAPAGQVFLADTLGELGTWYALSDIVFLGGSLRPIGGHNPFEVAHSGATVLSGTHVTNFAETFSGMEELGAARFVSDAADLAEKVEALFSDTQGREMACAAALEFAQQQTDKLDEIAARLITTLELSA
ncbi:3-deoxy-D-manno-octulosonic-acid transferase [Sulfitobacter brevis]|uniref:3-deoxy-D-manno-octulosonic acid transferase n=1 Tax=Sulfitobacter brevis TaxID=74348 RepID=A0A1I2C9W0_9RHOB|nr:3-deoxy-D-manno-octulosonic acid transferase [Sulfitobacter brevis]SFE64985.1 3-deoxy-D-manno-octulosonic-acid transferase [Sulfitobacter brevis]